MNSIRLSLIVLACVLWPATAQERETRAPTRLDAAAIEALTGLKGTWNDEEGVLKVTSPRIDMPVSVDRWTMPPFMGLTSWAAFQPGTKAEAMVMGRRP